MHPGMVVWPGDPPVQLDRLQDGALGDPATLSRLCAGLHAGTHVDAPLHFLAGGASIDTMPIAAMTGPARVLAIAADREITAADLAGLPSEPEARVLLKTSNSLRYGQGRFVEDFLGLTLEAAGLLVARGVRTLGIDYLSIAGYAADQGAIHRRLLGAGIWIIEGLDLSRVPPGDYDLFCLPLAIVGAEAAPARVLLRSR
jgi:arylformamidase